MKKTIQLLMLLVAIPFLMQNVYGQCDENITLTTQEEIDAFANIYGCSELMGNLTINGGGGALNFEGLNALTNIVGNLYIQNAIIDDLEGLNNLANVGGIFKIDGISPPMGTNEINLEGVDNLVSVGTLYLDNIYGNITFQGFNNLTTINTNFIVESIEGSVSFEGMESLTTVEGELYLHYIFTPINILGLSNLTTLGSLEVKYVNNLDNFEGLNNITTIPGDIYIWLINNNVSFQGFDNLETIGGKLHLSGVNGISFNGLNSLTSIGGKLHINDAFSANFVGLDNLVTIGEGVRLSDISSGVNFEGLGSLESIGQSFGQSLFLEGYFPVSFAGLSSLETLEGNFSIDNSVTNFVGLENLTSIGGTFIINEFTSSLTSFTGLENLTSIGGNFTIEQGTLLTNFQGLSSLETIGGHLTISGDNTIINSFDGLDNLQTIVQEIVLIRMNTLSNFEGLENLNYLGGIQMEYIDNFINFEGLGNLTHLGGIQMEDIDDFVNFEGLNSDLTTINGSIQTGQLVNFEGLNNITTITGALSVVSGDNFIGLDNLTTIGWHFNVHTWLTNFEGMEKLISIGGDFVITGNGDLDFEGLNSLTIISGDFIIDDTGVDNLDGLESLSIIGDNIEFYNNVDLESIAGLEGLFSLGDSIIFRYNYDLDDCCILKCFVDVGENGINLYNNGSDCSDYDDILDNCEEQSCYTTAYVSAFAYYDLNENGIYDDDEYGLLNQEFSVEPNAIFSVTNNEGLAKFLIETGEYTLSIVDNPLWELTSDDSQYTGVLEDSIIQHNFGLIPTNNVVDVVGDLTSATTRCGFEVNYWLSYENIGTSQTNGTISLALDSLVTLIEVTPMPTYESEGILYWNFEDLLPSYSDQIYLNVQMPGVDFIGAILESEGAVIVENETGDTLVNNTFSQSSTLTCAYDPNDKLVTPEGVGAPNYTLLEDSLLEYTIRFQNTGNDTAFNIVVRDTLSEFLNINSFRFVASSHNVNTQINTNERIIEFYFDDIYLPDSNINEMASQGFVKFSIETEDALAINTIVENTAGIFFDFNPPIVTNTTNNTLVEIYPILIANVDLKVFLEGAYNPVSGLMKTSLQDLSLLPLNQPFNLAPYNYDGLESVSSEAVLPENIVDWVLVEARSGIPSQTSSNTTIVESIPGFLLSDGSIVSIYGDLLAFRKLDYGASYHFVIRHRNHLDIISKESIVADDQMIYDFTLSQDQAFGTNQQKVLEDGKVVMYTGDYSQDGIIQVTDFDLWKEAPAQNNVYGNTDGTIDGIIQVTDYDAWIPNKAKIGNIEIRY